MQDEFAKYARLQRKINRLKDEISSMCRYSFSSFNKLFQNNLKLVTITLIDVLYTPVLHWKVNLRYFQMMFGSVKCLQKGVLQQKQLYTANSDQ